MIEKPRKATLCKQTNRISTIELMVMSCKIRKLKIFKKKRGFAENKKLHV